MGIEDETICFIDGVHPTHNVQLGYGWIKKGVEKYIPSNCGRSRINLTGAIDIITRNIVVQEDTTLNADATIRFFKKLENVDREKNKIHVFLRQCSILPQQRCGSIFRRLKNSTSFPTSI